MCILCAEIVKENLSIKEVAKAYWEIGDTDENHQEELLYLIDAHYDKYEVIDELMRIYIDHKKRIS